MADTFKFPNEGYDVTICRKKDILECIDKNIVDKDVAMAIIEHCEYTAAEYIKQGKWAGIPFIGNIRMSQSKKLIKSDEQQALIAEAKEQLDKEKYILFRKQLNKDNAKQIAKERYYKYIVSKVANKNRKLFNKLCKEKGEHYARVYMFSIYELTPVINESIKIIDDEL